MSAHRTGEPILVLDGLSKHFGGVKAVDQVSFTVNQGDVVGIIGPNGSGKTTLLRILLGREPPDRGVAETGHHIAYGYLPQDAPLFPHLDVRGNLLYGARSRDPLPLARSL